MTHWWKKYRDKGRGGTVQKRPHVQLSTSHTHINCKYSYLSGVFIISKSVDCIWNHIITTLTCLFQNTTCRDIYVGVTCGQLDMKSFLNMFHPNPCPDTSQSSLQFLKLKKKLMCLFVYFFDGLWPLEMIRVCHHQHQHSFLHLCSFVSITNHASRLVFRNDLASSPGQNFSRT